MSNNDIDTIASGLSLSDHDFTARLAKDYVADLASCTAAINGESVPYALGALITQLCMIRGIRYHPGFGDEVRFATPAFTRAWNARRIMSNEIPDIVDPDHVPYCIWHPQAASESTYRTLVQRNPQMRYQVARACAVAGYVDLYRELDVLPEVHVAEEARDNGSLAIFEEILAAPVRYAVMNDYDGTVNIASPRPDAFLNGDTAVRSSLEYKLKIQMPWVGDPFGDSNSGHTINDSSDDEDDLGLNQFVHHRFKIGYFNITEDGNIDTYDSDPENPHLTTARSDPDLISPLLYSPLPQDLPAGKKDVLILMAAYYGDIDRYARLRRPTALKGQKDCIMRGIFHNTLFAKWWANRIAAIDPETKRDSIYAWLDGMSIHDIGKAITARFIMNNDLSRVTQDTPAGDIPYCIWYPGHPDRETLKELVRRRPDMRQQAARTCIVMGALELFKELDPEPDGALLAEAEAKGTCSAEFAQFLRDKIDKVGPEFKLKEFSSYEREDWKNITRRQIREPWGVSCVLSNRVDEVVIGAPLWWDGIYEGYSVDTGDLELNVSGRDVMLGDGRDELDLHEFYAEGEGKEEVEIKGEDGIEEKGEGGSEGKGEGEGALEAPKAI